MFATLWAYHCPPLAVAIPLAFNAPRNFRERTCASLLCLADDGEHVGGIAIRLRLHGLRGVLVGRAEPWITKGHSASLGCRKRLAGTRGDERAFLLGQCCE